MKQQLLSQAELFFKKSSLIVDNIKVHGERKSVTTIQHETLPEDSVEKKKFTGIPQIDFLLRTIIDYILRDFLHSWYRVVTEDKEFVDVRTKGSIEETVGNICLR